MQQRGASLKDKRGLEWVKELESGDAALDNQTRELLRQANIFMDMMESIYKEEQLIKMLGVLTDYSRNHFRSQEDMMKRTRYPGMDEHTAEHRKFIHSVSKLYRIMLNQKKNLSPDDEDFDGRGVDGIIRDTYDFIMDWYDNHLLSTDKRFYDYLIYEK